MKYQKIRILMVVICVLAAGICYSCKKGEEAGVGDGISLVESSGGLVSGGDDERESGGFSALPASCYVHICGEVISPGVYEMEAGNRVFQAVEAAGGFTSDAAESYLNMAETISDGMKITVPNQSELQDLETGSIRADSKGKELVNLNTAAKEQLMTLRGVGEARAEDIIRYREEHGKFSRIEDIKKVSGIKDAAFQKIKDDITV